MAVTVYSKKKLKKRNKDIGAFETNDEGRSTVYFTHVCNKACVKESEQQLQLLFKFTVKLSSQTIPCEVVDISFLLNNYKKYLNHT